MIQYTCKKPLSMQNLLSQTESVNRKVPSGIIYTHNNLLHLDPGLFQYKKYIDTTVNIHRVIIMLQLNTTMLLLNTIKLLPRIILLLLHILMLLLNTTMLLLNIIMLLPRIILLLLYILMLLLNIIMLSTEHINVTTAHNNVTTEHTKRIGETEECSPKMHSSGRVILLKEYNTLRDNLRTSLLLQSKRCMRWWPGHQKVQ